MRHFRELHDEAGASSWVKGVLDEQKWEYQTEAAAGEGRIDYFVKTPQCNFGIEVKRDLFSDNLKMTTMADYFEQAVSYARALEAPVFLGPVIVPNSAPSVTYSGGPTANALAAFNIFGGRVNVGTLVFFNGYSQSYWGMILRGGVFWSGHKREQRGYENGFNPKKLSLVSSTGSKQKRDPLYKIVSTCPKCHKIVSTTPEF